MQKTKILGFTLIESQRYRSVFLFSVKKTPFQSFVHHNSIHFVKNPVFEPNPGLTAVVKKKGG